jgi:hypothetical protein
MKPGRRPDRRSDYRPLTRRRRVLIALLAVATALAVMGLVLRPKLARLNALAASAARPASAPAPCAPGQQQDCVGGTMRVIGAPPASAARP